MELTRNLLFANIPEQERERLRPFLQPFFGKSGQVIIEPNKQITGVWFPFNLITSTIIEMEDGNVVEVGVMGNEGMAGLQLFLGEETTNSTTLIQIPGEGMSMNASDFKKHVLNHGGPLHDLLHRYTHAFLAQVAQTAACNRVHPLDQRLCRWILMCHNRMGRDEFPLTQEFMGQMLGVRRPTVSTTASMLQKAGLISYSRGNLRILNRRGLENGACECHWVIAKQFDRIFGQTWSLSETRDQR